MPASPTSSSTFDGPAAAARRARLGELLGEAREHGALLVAADQRRDARHVEQLLRLAATHALDLGRDLLDRPEDVDRLRLALDADRVERVELDRARRVAVRQLVAQNALLRRRHQARRQVDDVADDGVLAARLAADVAAEDAAGGDADRRAHAEVEQRRHHAERRLDGALRIVLVRERRQAPHGDQHAALVVDDELAQRALEAIELLLDRDDGVLHLAEVLDAAVLHRQVAEHGGDRAQLGEVLDLARLGVLDLVQHGAGQKRRQIHLHVEQLRQRLLERDDRDRPRDRLEQVVVLALDVLGLHALLDQLEDRRRNVHLARLGVLLARAHLLERLAVDQVLDAVVDAADIDAGEVAAADARVQRQHAARHRKVVQRALQLERALARHHTHCEHVVVGRPLRQNRVAGVLDNVAAVLHHEADQLAKVRVEMRRQLLDALLAQLAHALGERREAADVGEQHGGAELLGGRAQDRLRALHQAPRHHAGHVRGERGQHQPLVIGLRRKLVARLGRVLRVPKLLIHILAHLARELLGGAVAGAAAGGEAARLFQNARNSALQLPLLVVRDTQVVLQRHDGHLLGDEQLDNLVVRALATLLTHTLLLKVGHIASNVELRALTRHGARRTALNGARGEIVARRSATGGERASDRHCVGTRKRRSGRIVTIATIRVERESRIGALHRRDGGKVRLAFGNFQIERFQQVFKSRILSIRISLYWCGG
jgi:hypothetical protein